MDLEGSERNDKIMNLLLEAKEGEALTDEEIIESLRQSIEKRNLNKVLIIPPDFTRFHSNAGFITNRYYHMLKDQGCTVDVLIAQGTHGPMSKEQFQEMYGDIPFEVMSEHRWREDTIEIGTVPGEYLEEISEGTWDEEVIVEVNKRVMDPSYDLILSVGQVVPHEVIGMANHSKNIFVGVGGSKIINDSHMIGAVFGLERIMGKDHSPVRKILDYGLEHFLSNVPIVFVLTVTKASQNKILTHGIYIGDERAVLENAIAAAQKHNIDFVEKGFKKCVVYLDPKEFHSTWLGNKAIYRTRMAIEDDGELVVLAPGVKSFGEDSDNDKIIRKYGYCGRKKILELFKENQDLRDNMGAAAHLIHGSSDERFHITYAVKNISKEEIERVGFQSADYDETAKRYNVNEMKYGWNIMPDGEEIFYIPNPALGLWIDKNRFHEM